ncbi:MAG: DUF5615 family PIN-like protein [Armatimonadetes bacterium]|nr:DUF5615 family PIN-like protein [Armatimonadota bacterium]
MTNRLAEILANENVSLRLVDHLRSLGHDVVTMHELGLANQRLPDEAVLFEGGLLGRAVLTMNRADFSQLHRTSSGIHSGIVTCTVDPDPVALAERVHDAIAATIQLQGQLIRVEKGGHYIV